MCQFWVAWVRIHGGFFHMVFDRTVNSGWRKWWNVLPFLKLANPSLNVESTCVWLWATGLSPGAGLSCWRNRAVGRWEHFSSGQRPCEALSLMVSEKSPLTNPSRAFPGLQEKPGSKKWFCEWIQASDFVLGSYIYKHSQTHSVREDCDLRSAGAWHACPSPDSTTWWESLLMEEVQASTAGLGSGVTGGARGLSPCGAGTGVPWESGPSAEEAQPAVAGFCISTEELLMIRKLWRHGLLKDHTECIKYGLHNSCSRSILIAK